MAALQLICIIVIQLLYTYSFNALNTLKHYYKNFREL